MQMGNCHGRITQVVFNTYKISERAQQLLSSPQEILLPSISQSSVTVGTETQDSATKGLTRRSKSTHLLPELKKLLSLSNNWFNIEEPYDYYFPGCFRTPYPQRLGFCQDITSLSFYNPEDKHFLFHDIQISKGKPRMPRKIATVVDQTEEEIYYQIVPCGGVKQCPVENCTYITSTREHRNCTNHPDKELVVQNECQVEFVYVWPANTDDNRRWLSGLPRRSDLQSSNLHNHRLN